MEPISVTLEHRGRKRRRKDVQSLVSGTRAKRQVITRGTMLLVGRYMKKDFEGTGVFLGKIVFYKDGLYRVEYEDGDYEDLDGVEVKGYLVEDSDLDKDLNMRKSKLDELILKKNVIHAENATNDAKTLKENPLTDISNGGRHENDDVGSNNDDDPASDEDLIAEVSVPVVPPPQLPPSSGNIRVPEGYVSYLLSVYGFLRSFSIQLFLSPFELDDFVGSLKSPLPNALLDAIHVALMRVLKRHLEMLASDDSELASKCMRFTDWSLLDTLTWPVCLVQYLMIMGHISGTQWKGFYVDALEKNYYSLPIGWKLMILQMLCDDVLESVELRSEIDIREEAEVGIDPDDVAVSETGPKRVHPRYSKTSASKNIEAEEIITRTHGTNSSFGSSYSGTKGTDLSEDANTVDDGNGDECRLCGMDGTLLCCDGCPSAYHSRCIGVSKVFIPEGTWYCPECAISRSGITIATGTSLTGAQLFGVDPYGHVFFGTCNHLLVLEDAIKSEPCCRYYHQNDIPKVLQALISSAQHVLLYSDICKGILQYWDIPKDIIIPFLVKVEMDEQSDVVKDDSQCPPISMPGGESHKLPDLVEDKKARSIKTEAVEENIVASCMEKTSNDSPLNRNLTNTTIRSCNGLLDMFFENKEMKQVTGAGIRKSSSVCLYNGLHFKSQAYINNYSQGDLAASAAASLAVISSEEKEVSESHALDKRRKMALADNLLQIKAFSSVAVRFFWPSTEKKLMEVPRERCGWCFSCKSAVTSRRGCLLNATASNAIKGAMKILSGLPALQNGDGSLRAIATYIILMEESLCGLVVGSFRTASHRKQWRKLVEQATTCHAIKSLLLELEENIRAVAFSANWFKLVDSWLVESSVPQKATIANGSTQKRNFSGRRGRKPSAVSDAASDDQTDSSIDFTWWRGGIFSKLIVQRGILPHSMAKKAARQGGRQRIPGIVYAEGSEIPKRSRRYFWRAAVQMSKNAPQLALQVRRLDLYVRWSDLVRPEQTLQDGKGQDTEASAFRNAIVSDKKNVEDKVTYGVAFRSQKHLPSRVMKNVIEVEESQDEGKKYWFSETRIPLYLIKEYEEKFDKMHLPQPCKPAGVHSNIQKRQLKASRKDIFSYLSCKRDNLVKCSCASCELDVLLRNAINCNVCEGFCHERCTIGSTNHKDGKVEYLITCKLCRTKSLPQSENKSPTSPLLVQGNVVIAHKGFKQTPVTAHKGFKQTPVTAPKGFKQTPIHKPLTPFGHVNSPLEMKSAARNSGSVSTEKRKIAYWGLIYKKNKEGKSELEKKKEDEDGLIFRVRHILGKRKSAITSVGPKCHLCDQPYNTELMYILCDTCKNWYHTDALEFDESKTTDLVGFKCCKCRRIKSPVCPYLDADKRRAIESKKLRTRGAKESNSEPDSPAISDQPNGYQSTPYLSPSTGEFICLSENDPLLHSLSMVDDFTELDSKIDTQRNSVPSAARTVPRKLPVRRLVNNEDDNNDNTAFFIAPKQENFQDQANDISFPPCVDWDASGNGFDDGISFDCNDLKFDDMEFEPQTYFSFNELLEPEDGAQADEANAATNDIYVDAFGNTCGDLENGFPEDLVMVDDGNTAQEPDFNIPADTSGNVIVCRGCSQADAGPYLCCEICHVCFHRHCSPWVEHCEGQWRCGNCREWR